MSRILAKILHWKILLAPCFEPATFQLALLLTDDRKSIYCVKCQPTFGAFQVASTRGDLAAAAIATVLVTLKLTQILYILKE